MVNTNVRSVTEQDQRQVANLLHFETYVHRHLDWRTPLDWIGHHPFLVLERSGSLLSALACPPDPPEVAWIRLFSVASNYEPQDAWNALWPAVLKQLENVPGISIAAIPLHQWFQSLLCGSGFEHADDVVMLQWDGSTHLLELKIDYPFFVRAMNLDDIPAVAEIDRMAFEPLWINTEKSLEYAFRQSTIATVVEDDGEVLGYQISTASPLSGHLARLAVKPTAQKRGIGLFLVTDMLRQFRRRGASRVTVNTQRENHASLALYQKAGFSLTNETYPVFRFSRS